MSQINPIALIGLQQQFHSMVIANPDLTSLVNRAPSELFAMCLLTMQYEYRVDETTGELVPTYTTLEAADRAAAVLGSVAAAIEAFEDGGEDTEITPIE